MSTQTAYGPATIALTVAGLIVAVKVLQILYTAATSPLRSIPGPWYSRFTNLILKRAVTGGKRIYYIDDLHKKYGSVVRISPREVAISDVDGFRQIHAVSSKFTKDIWYEKLTHFPALSVFTISDPKAHSVRRRLFARGFSKSYLREHWESTVKAKCKLAVEKIKKDAETDVADILKWWSFMAADVVARLGFGESFGLLEAGQVHRALNPFTTCRCVLTVNHRKPNTSAFSNSPSSATASAQSSHGSEKSANACQSKPSTKPSTHPTTS